MFILGSNSPRRKELLEDAGLEFKVVGGDFDESLEEENPEKLVKKLSYFKAQDISKKYPDDWILSADTIVISDDHIMGKPCSKDDARRMMGILSGKTHTVMTGYTVFSKEKYITDFVKTKVLFKNLSDEEINWYVNTSEPYDKAGGYAIQGMGAFMVKSIEGSYSNVVGLPVAEVIESLLKLNVIKRIIGNEGYSSN